MRWFFYGIELELEGKCWVDESIRWYGCVVTIVEMLIKNCLCCECEAVALSVRMLSQLLPEYLLRCEK